MHAGSKVESNPELPSALIIPVLEPYRESSTGFKNTIILMDSSLSPPAQSAHLNIVILLVPLNQSHLEVIFEAISLLFECFFYISKL